MIITKIDPFARPEAVMAIVTAYREAFGGKPWNEGYLCLLCETVLPLENGSGICPVCAKQGKQVLLVEYWPETKVVSDFYREMMKPEPFCLVVEEDENIIGFAWGYKISTEPEIDGYLEAPCLHERIEGDFFYLDECAIIPPYQGRGIGTLVVRRIFAEKQRILLRTLNDSRMFDIVGRLGGKVVQHISRNRVIIQLIST